MAMEYGEKCLRKSKHYRILWATAIHTVELEKFKTEKEMLARFNELIKYSNTVHTFNPAGQRGIWV